MGHREVSGPCSHDVPRRRFAGRLGYRAFVVLLAFSAAAACGCSRTLGRPAQLSFDPVTVPGVAECRGITAGAAHACALQADGTITCWGNNVAGQLGNGTTANASIPVAVSGISGALAVSAGRVHTCALLADATVACWGDNHEGQLGNVSIAASPFPVPVSGVTRAVALASGWAHTCALLDDGAVQCWGNSSEGQLGTGSRRNPGRPIPVSRLSTARALTAGVAHTCAVLERGSVACWGTDGFGQAYGRSFGLRSLSPVIIAGISTAVVAAAGRNHTCALLRDGTVKCWGANLLGQLGAPGGAVSPSSPVTVEGISDAVAISAGYFHTCVLLRDGSVRCWGANVAGQLGARSGGRAGSVIPVGVTGDLHATAIAAGGAYTCALLLDGDVVCWGGNDFNQLGGPVGSGGLGG